MADRRRSGKQVVNARFLQGILDIELAQLQPVGGIGDGHEHVRRWEEVIALVDREGLAIVEGDAVDVAHRVFDVGQAQQRPIGAQDA